MGVLVACVERAPAGGDERGGARGVAEGFGARRLRCVGCAASAGVGSCGRACAEATRAVCGDAACVKARACSCGGGRGAQSSTVPAKASERLNVYGIAATQAGFPSRSVLTTYMFMSMGAAAMCTASPLGPV